MKWHGAQEINGWLEWNNNPWVTCDPTENRQSQRLLSFRHTLGGITGKKVAPKQSNPKKSKNPKTLQVSGYFEDLSLQTLLFWSRFIQPLLIWGSNILILRVPASPSLQPKQFLGEFMFGPGFCKTGSGRSICPKISGNSLKILQMGCFDHQSYTREGSGLK